MYSIFIVLVFIVIPRINFLYFILPSDEIEQLAIFIFAILLVFFAIDFVEKVYSKINKKKKNRKSDLERQNRNLEYLSKKINEFPYQSKRIILSFITTQNASMRLEEVHMKQC